MCYKRQYIQTLMFIDDRNDLDALLLRQAELTSTRQLITSLHLQIQEVQTKIESLSSIVISARPLQTRPCTSVDTSGLEQHSDPPQFTSGVSGGPLPAFTSTFVPWSGPGIGASNCSSSEAFSNTLDFTTAPDVTHSSLITYQFSWRRGCSKPHTGDL